MIGILAILLLVLAVIVLAIAGLFLFQTICFVLKPIRDAVERATYHERSGFNISDLFALVLLISVPFALLSSFAPVVFQSDRLLSNLPGLAIVVVAPIVVVWWIGTVTLRHLNVGDWKRRILFLTFVNPFAILGPFLCLIGSTNLMA